MSNKKREPLVSDAQMRDMVTCGLSYVDDIRMVGAVRVNSWHEAARAKDAELIQQLVDTIGMIDKYAERETMDSDEEGAIVADWGVALAAAEAAGFKPTEQ